jgi:hypothetical protein
VAEQSYNIAEKGGTDGKILELRVLMEAFV